MRAACYEVSSVRLAKEGRIRSIPIPRRSYQTASLLKLNKAWAGSEGALFSLRMLAGRPRSLTAAERP